MQPVARQILTFDANTTETTVTGLYPTSTYQFKLAVVGADGAVGPDSVEATGDTLAAGCGPKGKKEKKAGCVIS